MGSKIWEHFCSCLVLLFARFDLNSNCLSYFWWFMSIILLLNEDGLVFPAKYLFCHFDTFLCHSYLLNLLHSCPAHSPSLSLLPLDLHTNIISCKDNQSGLPDWQWILAGTWDLAFLLPTIVLELISSITLLPPVVMSCYISYMSVQSPSPLLTHTLPKTHSQHCLLWWCLCLLDTYHIFRVFKLFPFWGTLDIGCWKPYLFPGTPITLHLGPLAFWGLLGKWRDFTFQKGTHKVHHSRTWWEQRWVKQN